MNKMAYFPQYPILRSEDMVPRDQIRLVPDSELPPFLTAEIANVKKGVEYKMAVADTPQNREAVYFRTAYMQMAAHKEGWRFDPQLYQVRFVPPGDPRLKGVNDSEKRIYNFGNDKGEKGIMGFESRDGQRTFTRISDDNAKFVDERVRELF